MQVKNLLSIIGLGVAIWGLSLVWPEVNGVLTPRVTLGLIAGLGAAGLAQILSHYPNHHPRQHQAKRERVSRPILAIRPR
jgi:hypothetical protein